jgi:2-haloacid dehalogenase
VSDVATGLRALLFDVFGTCVDWRSSVARQAEALGRARGVEGVSWEAFADAWRGRYQPQMETVRSGARPWVDLDVLHREALDDVVAEFGLDGALGPADRDALTRAWHRLDPWPDTVPGLIRLRARFVVAPNSNGHVALMVDLARHAGLPWDAILGAEVAGAYKPLPAAYLRSVAMLGLEPGEAMMVAAHNDDLVAARACGLRTGFLPRPTEYGPAQATDLAPAERWDVVADDLTDLAARLGA